MSKQILKFDFHINIISSPISNQAPSHTLSPTISSSSFKRTIYPHMDEADRFIDELPKVHFMESLELREWDGYWLMPPVKDSMTFRMKFDARNDDVFLASFVKTGTTCLKLIPRILHHPKATPPNPRHGKSTFPRHHNRSRLEEAKVDAYDPRLLHTHLPHVLLPDSVKNSACKIIYIARNPKDTVISSWHFYNLFLRRDQESFSLEEYVDCFCSGKHPYGPYVGHVAEYWQESKREPQKILFVKYEDLKKDPKLQVMKIAEFLEMPFGDGDEGEVEEIVGKCSLERLKNLEVNKSGSHFVLTPNNMFFRKGEVGDFKNYLTPQMEMKIHQSSLKLEGLGLYF